MKTEDDLDWLHSVRSTELDKALEYFPDNPSARILEIGSGTGYMLQHIRTMYPNSIGLEVENSMYEFSDEDITLYDGHTIPFPDARFDVVFSSHVLEHVPHIQNFIEEMARVLKPGGVAVNIMPSPTWRILTSVMHYFAIAKIAISMFGKKGQTETKAQTSGRSKGELVKFLLYAPRHGEIGNVITEIYYFSKGYWKRVFSASSLKMGVIVGVGLVYWGRDIFRLSLPLTLRRILAKLIGSSSNLYVLHKK